MGSPPDVSAHTGEHDRLTTRGSLSHRATDTLEALEDNRGDIANPKR
jgi:hypothetical protein